MCASDSDRLDMVAAARTLPAAWLAAGLLALSSGCVSMELPEPFVVLSRSTKELKAVTPEDARIWVRIRSVAANTNLAFWSKLLENEFARNRGYTLIEGPKDIADGNGVPGKEYVFEVTAQGLPQRYLLAVFVIDDRVLGFLWLRKKVCTVEFVAPKDDFALLVEAVRKGIGTLDP